MPRRAAVVALALSIGGAAAAVARPLRLVLTPSLPTWNDLVRLRVEGEVETSCGPQVVHLGNVRKSPQLDVGPQLDVAPSWVDVDLTEEPCDALAPAAVVAFASEVDLGRLLHGPTVVRVHDLAAGGTTELQVVVHGVALSGLDVSEPAVSDRPVRIGVNFYQQCNDVEDEVAGNVITLTISEESCNLTPLGPRLTREEFLSGPLPPGDYEVRLVEANSFAPRLRQLPLRVWNAAGCVPADDRLCLHAGRFRVSAQWRAFDGSTGIAHAAPLAGNEESGLLWFFGPKNSELAVKLVKGCDLNQRWWAFVSSSSTVEYDVTVTDTSSGASRTYHNDLGQVPKLIADTSALPCS